jgi:small-conductance mechanosensitive channel
VGGLAVALGLQDTLSNLFAGIHVLLSEPIRVGDYVRLESGEEGFVTDIQWRYTRLRLLANNVVIVPNSKLAQSIITNYDRPQSELAVPVEVGVHYDSDLDQVERVTIEVAREVMRNVAGGVAEFEPFIRYHTFGESSIDFTAVLRGRGFTDQFLVKHEFVKRLRARYAAEGIVIPFPIRTLELPSEIEEKLRA